MKAGWVRLGLRADGQGWGSGCGCAAGNESPGGEAEGGVPDFTSKLLHLAWHPQANLIACAASNSLYMYYA